MLTLNESKCYYIPMIDLVGKIGSMALIDVKNGDIDYNRFARIGKSLSPNMVWVTSGATEIGRLDFYNRNGYELDGNAADVKTDYAAQGQAILMKLYRDFINPRYSVRQVLVEHQHFNDQNKRRHLKELLVRAGRQGAIPVINYNDCVSDEETRKLEINRLLSDNVPAAELVDNDETAARIASLLEVKTLLILTNLEGIYYDLADKTSLIRRISGNSAEELIANIDKARSKCVGASRVYANGAGAKLEYIKDCAARGTKVYIASADYSIKDVLSGNTPCTLICLNGED